MMDGQQKRRPQLEVRVTNLSISARVPVVSEAAHEIPTISNVLKRSIRRVAPGGRQDATRPILHEVNAVFKPGTMTLLLGQPGAGKSSLLKILSGQFPTTNTVAISGGITYNGMPSTKLRGLIPQFASYVAQRDAHFPTLTVKETIELAQRCSGQRTPGSDAIMEQLGISKCTDTIVGDAVHRGVSGGERKRVTVGEMQFGDRNLIALDEISTGLDSATTFDIVSAQRDLAKSGGKTIIAALQQPSPEVYSLFDDVMLLIDGHVVYHGPCREADAYFTSLGFIRPSYRDIADFLIDLGTPQQQQYQADRHCPTSGSEFAEHFARSSIFESTLADLAAAHSPELLSDMESHFARLPTFYQSFWGNVALLAWRQLHVTFRNVDYIKGRAFMVVVVGLISSSIFWQFDPTKVQVVLGVIFQGILFLDLGQVLQLPIYMEARPIFYKQRAANFYRTSSYVIASSIGQIPLAAAETIVFGTMMYWMCGFVPVFTNFLVFLTLIFLTNMVLAALFFLMAASCKDLNVATPASLVVIILITIYSGFLVSKDQIPSYLRWVYWLNPITWCVRGVAINEYRSERFNVDVYDGIDYMAQFGMQMGPYMLSLFDIESARVWIAASYLALATLLVAILTSSFFVLEYVRFDTRSQSTIVNSSDVDQEEEDTRYTLVTTPKRGAIITKPTVEVDIAYQHIAPPPVTIAFKDLWYCVPDPARPESERELLKGVSGFARPGTMTALMGSSGAGKTTLMDVIAGRKTGGTVRGEILLNGYPATKIAMRRSTGYCEQMDVHAETATFREALTFSAFLRQSADASDAQKRDAVEECLDLLGLGPIADRMIRGSSVEQMKRLTIGVELAAQPSVLFLDEPTSGLDARSAKLIMDGVRRVANTGCTVVCTIHQPSWEVFQVFDSLLLLKRGGETVFFGELGPDARELVSFFESIDGVTPMEKGYNPATWMLEVIGAGVNNATNDAIDFVAHFASSDKKAMLDAALIQEGMTKPSPLVPPVEFAKKRAATNATQARLLLQRFAALYWRSPSFNITRIAVNIFLAIVFGLTFVGAEYNTYQGINSGQGMMYYVSLGLGIVSFNSVIPLTVEERAPYYRERAAETYNAWWYFVAGTLIEIPYVFGGTFIFTAIFFPLVGFSGVAQFALFWTNAALYVLLQTYWAQLLVFALPSIEVASTIGMLVLSVSVFFAGFNPPASAIPAAYEWLYRLTPHTYTLAILSATVFGDCPDDGSAIGCQPITNLPPTLPANMTIKEYIGDVFFMRHSEIPVNVAAVLGFIVLFRILALVALRFLNYQKR